MALCTKLSVLVLSIATPWCLQEPVGDAKQDVKRVIQTWLQVEDRIDRELEDSLVALGKPATPYLCELLDTHRGGAPAKPLAHAIGRVGHSKAPDCLGRLLESEVISERLAAVQGLGTLGVRDCCPHLVTALDDAEGSIVRKAESMLLSAKLSPAWVVEAVVEGFQVTHDKTRLARLLGKKGGEEAHAVLVGMAEDWRPDLQLAGLQGLSIIGNGKDGELAAELLVDGHSVAVQKQACLLLGKIRHRAATRDLIDALHMSDKGLVSNAHWALQRITGLKVKADPQLWELWWERKGKPQDRE